MEQNKTLGIYITPSRATIVLIGRAGGKIEIAEQFSVAVAPVEGTPFSFAEAAKGIAAGCTEKQLLFSDVAVALDCRLYRQQVLHSEFTEYRQISQTVKFDAEESLAVNAAETAVAFELASKGVSGSEVSVYAAGASVVSEIITTLAGSKLDPVSIEPDSICLRRILSHLPGYGQEIKTMLMAVSKEKCFIISPPPQVGNAQIRAFLTAESQNKTNLAAREIMFSTVSTIGGRDIQKTLIYDSTGKVNVAELGQSVSVAVEPFGTEQIIVSAELPADTDGLDIIIAAGAAAGLAGKCDKVDFRTDFMPYQGKRMILEKAVKTMSFCLLAVFIVLGVLLQIQYQKTSGVRNDLKKKFKAEYSIAMPGGRFVSGKDALGKLKREINRIKDVKSGLLTAGGDDSVEAKLTFLFEAINSVPKNVDIEIDKIVVTTKTMNITGNTSPRGYLELFGAVDKHQKLIRGQSTYQSKDNRDQFRLTIDLK
ncbi:MAG: hypothetical protein WC765_05700 [Phycisphaerae bacterium]